MEYIGLDVHKQHTTACIFDDDTGEVRHVKLNNSRKEFEKLFASCHSPQVVLEAGRSSYMIFDTIEDLVPDIQIAHPKQVKAIAWAVVKTDKVDAETLCKLLRADVVPQTYIRNQNDREVLYQLRQRMFFVKVQTMTKNRIHSLIDRQPEEVRNDRPNVSDLFGKAGRKWLENLKLAPAESNMLEEMLKMHYFLNEQIKESNRLVYRLFKEDPVAQLLKTIPGIGKFFAVLIRAEIGDINRFWNEKKLTGYAGLAPRTISSGDKTYHGRLPKDCNHYLKWAMIEAVHPAKKKSHWIKNRFEKLKNKKDHNTAKVSTARLLITLVYKIWTQNRPYTPVKPLSGNRSYRVALSHS